MFVIQIQIFKSYQGLAKNMADLSVEARLNASQMQWDYCEWKMQISLKKETKIVIWI